MSRKNLLTGKPNPRSKCARKTTRSLARGTGTSSSPGTRKSRFRGILRARRSIKICISVTSEPFQAPRWFPAAPSSPIEASEAVMADGGEEGEETGGGASGNRRELRPPMAAEAESNALRRRGGGIYPAARAEVKQRRKPARAEAEREWRRKMKNARRKMKKARRKM